MVRAGIMALALVNQSTIDRQIADLAHPLYFVRQNASAALSRRGEFGKDAGDTRKALSRAAMESPDWEVRKRAQAILRPWYPCSACNGKGLTFEGNEYYPPEICNRCHGTRSDWSLKYYGGMR